MFAQNNEPYFPKRSLRALSTTQGTLLAREVKDHTSHPWSVPGQELKGLSLPAKHQTNNQKPRKGEAPRALLKVRIMKTVTLKRDNEL